MVNEFIACVVGFKICCSNECSAWSLFGYTGDDFSMSIIVCGVAAMRVISIDLRILFFYANHFHITKIRIKVELFGWKIWLEFLIFLKMHILSNIGKLKQYQLIENINFPSKIHSIVAMHRFQRHCTVPAPQITMKVKCEWELQLPSPEGNSRTINAYPKCGIIPVRSHRRTKTGQSNANAIHYVLLDAFYNTHERI